MIQTLAETIRHLEEMRTWAPDRDKRDALAITVEILGRVQQGREKAEKKNLGTYREVTYRRLPNDDGQWDDTRHD